MCQRPPKDFEEAGHEVYNPPQANLVAALAEIGQLPDTLNVCRSLAHVRVTTIQVEE
jgi:hypothetical protein